MTVKTKFDIGDTCWVMSNNRCASGVVKKFDVRINREHKNNGLAPDNGKGFKEAKVIKYYVKLPGREFYAEYPEHECFATKKELLNSL